MLNQSHLFPVCTRSNLTTRNFDILRDLSLPANVSQSGDYDVMIPDPRRGLRELRSGVSRDIPPGSHVTCVFITTELNE